MTKSARRARKKRMAQETLQGRKGPRCDEPMDPLDLLGPETDREEEDDIEIREPEELVTQPSRAQETIDCDIVNMVKTLNGAIAAVSQDTARIQRVYQELCIENTARDKALADLTAMVREYGSSPEAMRPYGRSQGTTQPHPTIQADVMDGEGNLRAADIGITWEGNETFLHGVGPQFSPPVCQGPVMSTPYPPEDGEDRKDSSTTAQAATPATPDTDGRVHRPSPEVRQGYRPAAPIQRFNNKSLNWPAWFRHFRAVADVHGWNKDQRALQLVSYLDETAMNVAQELGDSDLYNYDVLVKLLGDRFDPASRVSAFRSRFHGRSRSHHEDADTFSDALSELCRVGYPQSPPELRQELIAEQFVQGQSDPELKKYLWVVIRTQKDRKLQTLVEVCTDFSSLMTPSQIHRPAEQTFAVHQEVRSYPEDEGELEDMFAVGDSLPWNNRRPPEPSTTPTLQRMFTLACRSNSGNRSFSDQNRGFRPQTRTGRDYSKIKCFSCGQFGHMQTRCPQPGRIPAVQTCRLATPVR